MADRAHASPGFPPGGIDPQHWYDSDDFCAILHVAEKRRLKLAAELRGNGEAIKNGSSFIAEGLVMLKLLRVIES